MIKTEYFTLIIGSAQIYMWATTYYLPAIFIPAVADTIKQQDIFLISGFSWALLISGLCATKIGRWIQEYGGRIPLLTSSILSAIGLMLLSTTNELVVWYISWTILGLAMALGLFNASCATIECYYGNKSKEIIVKVILISGFSTFFWPITNHLIELFGWRITLCLYAIPHMFILAPIYFFTIPKDVPKKQKMIFTTSIIPKNSRGIFYLLVIFGILRYTVSTSGSVYMIKIFRDLGFSIENAAFIAALIGPSQIVSRLIEAVFGHKFHHINSYIFWASILPISILVILWFGPSAVLIFSIAYGLSNGMVTITMNVLPLILFSPKIYPSVLGKLAIPIFLTQAASPIVTAFLIDSCSTKSIFIATGIISFIALLCLTILSQLYNNSKIFEKKEDSIAS